MPEWKTYKGQSPWALEQQGNKFGYVNNPNFHFPATEDHVPCGYWSKGTRPSTVDYAKTVWYVDGSAVMMAVLEVGAEKEYETLGDACLKASSISGAVLLLVFPGSYESGGIISGSNRTVYIRGMGVSPLDVEFLNCCPQVSGAGHNLFIENAYIHYETGAGFTSLQFSASMGDLTLNKVYFSDPNVPVEYTPFLAGLTWTGSLTASYCTIAATFNWELVFFQFSPSKISFNKVSYVGGYWGESSCAVQFATYNPAVEDCGAMFGSFRILEETEVETLSLTPLWPSTRWQTFDKGLAPWIARPMTSLAYNEGDKIALAPKVSGGSPVWDMEHHGKAITDEHIPCQYWFNGDWEAAYVITKLCESINIAYTSNAMLANTTQVLSLEDSTGNAITTDIVTWTLSGVGSLTGEVGSSVVYNAPVEYLEDYDTSTIEVWCNGVVRDILVITIINSSIYYTTPQQPPGTDQDLPIDNPNPACEYTWELVGGGSLSVVNGVMRYTAPTTNPNCENNATISLLCNGVVIDTIKIAITVINDPWIAYHEESPCLEYCSPAGSGLGTNYYFTVTGYKCDGTVREGPLERLIYAGGGDPGEECPVRLAVLNAQCVTAYGLACCAAYETGLVHQFLTPNDSPGIHDNRTEAQKLAGCCPAQLM